MDNYTLVGFIQLLIIVFGFYFYFESEREKGNRKEFSHFRKVIHKKHFDEHSNPIGFSIKLLENGKGIPVDNKGNDISHLLDWELEEVYKDKSSVTPILAGLAAVAAIGAVRGAMHKRKPGRPKGSKNKTW
jgi:hypothetical protein